MPVDEETKLLYEEMKPPICKPSFIKTGEEDVVNHPSHYTSGKIEVIDFIDDQNLNYERGNAIKYICRAGKKDPNKEIEDLQKAVWYIQREIKNVETRNKEKNNSIHS